MHECDDSVMKNIPVKHTVKYLGIHITKNLTERQQLRLICFVEIFYPRSLSLCIPLPLFINNKSLKEINKTFLDFTCKNKPHKRKKEVLSDSSRFFLLSLKIF